MAGAPPPPGKSMDYHWRNASTMPIVCYTTSITSSMGVWSGANPLNHTVPLFLLQLLLIVLTSRIVAILLRPLRQPHYVSEVIGGLVLGPTVLGRIDGFLPVLFPYRSVPILDVVAHLGIIYFVFIIGLEIDPTVLKRSGKHATFAAACMLFPFAISAFSGFFVHQYLQVEAGKSSFVTFLGVALSVTSFSVLARTLTEFKLTKTNLGLTTLSTAMFIDKWSWFILSLAFSISSGHPSATIWTLLSGIIFMVSSYKVVTPTVLWLSRRKLKGEVIGELPGSIILIGVMVWALLGDAIGINAISGAFLYGLCIPYGPVGVALVERVGDLVEGLFMPLFFVVCGLGTNLYSIENVWAALGLALVVLLAAVAKVAACMSVGYMYEMPLNEGFAMGLLLSTRGVIEMVILKIGRDSEVLSEQAFSVLVVMSVVVMATVTRFLRRIVDTSRNGDRAAAYERRRIEWPDPHSELRMLFCIHNARNVPSLLSLLEASNPTKLSPVFVFPLNLIELTGRASAMLVVHDTTNSVTFSSANSHQHGRSRHMIQTFESYAQRTTGVTIQPLTAVSSYSSMHEDVCGVAKDNRVALIVLPFHKQPTVDGDMQVTNPAIRSLNESVLASAPCSVAILVDHGFSGPSRMAAGQHATYHVALLFFGGADDREALALASRMAEHDSITLTLFRFIPDVGSDDFNSHASIKYSSSHKLNDMLTKKSISEEEAAQLDEVCIRDFRAKNVSEEAVVYMEKVARNAEETVSIIRSIERIHDLYIVGKTGGLASLLLTNGLAEWCECPELGTIGDMLASKDFGTSASVLVVQQGRQEAPLGGGTGGVAMEMEFDDHARV
ncbi:cation/H(+) antiporter 15-like [Canna indica]|uniref:Cation/H(+) antiporter 15-like n=1 Tax=Canna indica TaxID=4628 RepID=A0AAQ3QKS2_9LILI|nr:cation/H(+) antiporter 15-like [Canna indica]